MKTIINGDTRDSMFVMDDSVPVEFKGDTIVVGDPDDPEYIIADKKFVAVAEIVENVTDPMDWERGKYWVGENKGMHNVDVPKGATNHQVVTQIERDGLKGQVTAFLANPGNEESAIAYNRKNQFGRDSTFIADLMAGIGLNAAQTDDLFKAAALIE